MARENDVKLIGIIQNIEKDENNKIAKIILAVIKRNGRIDYPQIFFYAEHFDSVKDLKLEDTVIIKGFYATANQMKEYRCPKCGKVLTSKTMISSVIGFYACKLNGKYLLDDLKEVSNSVTLLGPLCRNVKLKVLPSGVKNAQYQMAIGRKMRVAEQQDVRTDFPFISSLGEQAEEDYKRMEEGCQCYINGSIQTRSISKVINCDCGHGIVIDTPIMEICPYNVEYLFACKFDNEE